jgi:hypothetical protein
MCGMERHATRPVTSPRGHTADIDLGIADLIEALWARGVNTAQSCEEMQPGLVWIAFHYAADSLDFLRALNLSDDTEVDDDGEVLDDLIERALNPTVASPGDGWSDPWAWRWTAQPVPSAGCVSLAVEFPRADVPELVRRLTKQ